MYICFVEFRNNNKENKCQARHSIKQKKMITLEVCKKILNNGERKYKDDEIKMIREYLYYLGSLQLEIKNNEFKN